MKSVQRIEIIDRYYARAKLYQFFLHQGVTSLNRIFYFFEINSGDEPLYLAKQTDTRATFHISVIWETIVALNGKKI
jgi:hypothetical protein